MAFGFIRRLVDKIKGGKPAPENKGARPAKKPGERHGGGKRGRQRAAGERANPDGRGNKGPNRKDRSRSKDPRRGGAPSGERGETPRQQQGADARPPRRRDDKRRDDRRRGGARRESPRGANTPADEMRPGGVVSAEERALRRQAHDEWSLDSFVVDPVEGKKRFHDFDLPSEVMHGIADLGFKYCTEIQALSLEHALAGENIAGKAQTGSGKTAAFLTAILARYMRTPEKRQKKGGTPRALVLAPTRELVIQICKDADAIGKYCELRQLAVYGGMDYDRQKRELLEEPVDLLVATPGRLIDFCRSHVVDLSHVDTLVIDEADRMLDMGFIPDVRRIMSFLPPKELRATMLYSATLDNNVMRLASQWMQQPVKAEVEEESAATDTVRQVVYVCRADDKFRLLYNHLALYPEARTLVFCNRKSTTDDVASSLAKYGIPCEMLSGDVNQNKRLRVLEDFRAGAVRVVVATDVAGRGIHVDDIEFVVNFDFPYEAEDYVHRIGRTGRAGQTGIAISFADEDESFQIPEIEKYINEPLKCTMILDDDPLLKPLPPPPPRGKTAAPAPVDAEARAVVSAREAVTAEEMAAAARLTGVAGVAPQPPAPDALEGAAAPDSAQEQDANPEPHAPAVRTPPPPEREMPTFDSAFETKKVRDESNAYSGPVSQQTRFEDWTPGQ